MYFRRNIQLYRDRENERNLGRDICKFYIIKVEIGDTHRERERKGHKIRNIIADTERQKETRIYV